MFSGTIGIRVVIGDFNSFLEKPADCTEFQMPTQDQLLSTGKQLSLCWLHRERLL